MVERELKEVKIEIEILGYKGHITSITSQTADGIWRKKDMIVAWITFDEPVESTVSFPVSVPAKSYTRDEFLKAVKTEGDVQLRLNMKGDQARREARRRADEKQKELNSVVSDMAQRLCL
ncbi:unnamed protein product [marine sediment metagenome]|uniref:Uncharacterized protein n=1 Tax=marine sediment metagenome TaxID=412755 RepID=X1QGE7_9ZZZZ